jgi:hypothetical protein
MHDPVEQHVGPVHPSPPHWPHSAEQPPPPLEVVVVVPGAEEVVVVPPPPPPLVSLTDCRADPLPPQPSTAITW